jgi:CheY-like chemotaxis protein
MLNATLTPAHNVLVVEDDDDTRELLREALEAHGYAVACAANGDQALEHLRASSPLPDVILLDLMMPVMNGWQFRSAQRRDQALASIPVVVITASGASRERAGLMVDQIVLKPVRLPQLLGAIVEATSAPRRPC